MDASLPPDVPITSPRTDSKEEQAATMSLRFAGRAEPPVQPTEARTAPGVGSGYAFSNLAYMDAAAESATCCEKMV
jgi:hypothetical protein